MQRVVKMQKNCFSYGKGFYRCNSMLYKILYGVKAEFQFHEFYLAYFLLVCLICLVLIAILGGRPKHI